MVSRTIKSNSQSLFGELGFNTTLATLTTLTTPATHLRLALPKLLDHPHHLGVLHLERGLVHLLVHLVPNPVVVLVVEKVPPLHRLLECLTGGQLEPVEYHVELCLRRALARRDRRQDRAASEGGGGAGVRSCVVDWLVLNVLIL